MDEFQSWACRMMSNLATKFHSCGLFPSGSSCLFWQCFLVSKKNKKTIHIQSIKLLSRTWFIPKQYLDNILNVFIASLDAAACSSTLSILSAPSTIYEHTFQLWSNSAEILMSQLTLLLEVNTLICTYIFVLTLNSNCAVKKRMCYLFSCTLHCLIRSMLTSAHTFKCKV